MVSWFDSHIWVSYSPQSIQLVHCLTYHPLCSLVITPDGDQVAATSPSLFPNLWSLIEKYSGKMKGSTEPRLVLCHDSLNVLRRRRKRKL